MIHRTIQLDGERLRELLREGFADEAVVVVPMGDVMVECGFRVMDMPNHTAPTDAPRAATLDEIAEVAVMLAKRAEVREDRTDLSDRTDRTDTTR
jgi:hypothetical protein